jgi:ubiquinone/menaquinone biosynthesis C-methylase UbiE
MTSNDEIDALLHVDPSSNIPERIVPGLTVRAEAADHMARYGFAATLAHGATLDLGSGVGYGAAIIATAQPVDFVIAFDISSSALAFGKSSYGERVSFVTGDARALPFPKNSFDSIVCLEAIEHVPDARRVLEEIVRVLRPEGVLIISTPNKWATSPLSRGPMNPYHVCEWYPRGFKEMVATYFEIEEVVGQSWHSIEFTLRALRRNITRHVKAFLSRLRLLGIAQRMRKAGRGGAQALPRGASSALDVPVREEILAAWPRSWTSTRKQGIPVTMIVIAKPHRT